MLSNLALRRTHHRHHHHLTSLIITRKRSNNNTFTSSSSSSSSLITPLPFSSSRSYFSISSSRFFSSSSSLRHDPDAELHYVRHPTDEFSPSVRSSDNASMITENQEGEDGGRELHIPELQEKPRVSIFSRIFAGTSDFTILYLIIIAWDFYLYFSDELILTVFFNVEAETALEEKEEKEREKEEESKKNNNNNGENSNNSSSSSSSIIREERRKLRHSIMNNKYLALMVPFVLSFSQPLNLTGKFFQSSLMRTIYHNKLPMSPVDRLKMIVFTLVACELTTLCARKIFHLEWRPQQKEKEENENLEQEWEEETEEEKRLIRRHERRALTHEVGGANKLFNIIKEQFCACIFDFSFHFNNYK